MTKFISILIIAFLLLCVAPVWAACGTSYLDKLVTTGTAAAVGTSANPILGQGRFIPPAIAVVNCVGVSLSSVTDGGGAYKVKISEINMQTSALGTTEDGCTSDNVSMTSGSSGTEIIFPNLSCLLTPKKSYGIAVFKANGETDNNHYVSLLSKSADNGLAGFRMIWNTNGTLKSISPTADFGLKLYTAKPETKGLYTYVVADGKAIISATSCGSGNITIPDTLGGYPVTVIGSSVFTECDKITSITVPASVTKIETNGLETAIPITSAHFKGDAPSMYEDGILLLKEGAKIYYCSGAPGYTNPWHGYETAAETCKGSPYTASVSTTTTILVENGYSYTVTDNQSTITAHDCPTGALVIPDTLGGHPTVAIADNVFTGCTGLTSVTVPNSITSIGNTAFAGCTGLASVTLGSGVITISPYAFTGCTNLTSITFPDSVASIGNNAFLNCTNLYTTHFLGNAPTLSYGVFFNHKIGFTVYYITGATGFTLPTWNGYLSAVETTPRTSLVWDRTTVLTGLPNIVMEPTLIQPEKGRSQFFDNNTTIWKMWFHSLVDDNIYYAESLDGVAWQQLETAVIDNAACPFIIKDNTTYYMYVAKNGNTTLGLYTSSDGRNWTLAHKNMIPLGDNGTWNDTMIGNPGGAIVNGTLYLFLEVRGHISNSLRWRIGLFTSTDFYTFTPAVGNPIIVSPYDGDVGGPSAPYLIGGTWWIWTHGNPGTVDGNIEGDIYRYSASELTGPWTRNPTGISFPRATQDAGVGSSIGETDDPHILDVTGKTYLYYIDVNDGTAGGYAGADMLCNIKLAIADMPISVLVTTDEYDYSLFYLQFLQPESLWLSKKFTPGCKTR